MSEDRASRGPGGLDAGTVPGLPDAGDPPSDAAAPPVRVLRAGAVIGDLELVAKIGEGAQGVVYRAVQRSVGRQVAVKILPEGRSYGDDQIERFRREAEAAGRLVHPNIVSTHAFREWQGHHLIVQEFVEGGDLEESIDSEAWDESSRTDTRYAWAADMARQLAEGLHHAHTHGVVHRDVKPSNILLTPEGIPKLTDFGLAKVADKRGMTMTGVAMGTPNYMSPEQVTAERERIDHRTDIYSLGAVLYKMLTRRVPFTGESQQGLLIDILTRDPTPPRKSNPSIDRDLEAVCLKCLEKDPADRYGSAAALAHDLALYLEGRDTSARPVSVIDIPFRRMRRLATSSLMLIALLAPVAWVALDLALLRPQAEATAELHDVRIGAVALAALMFMWPLTVLAIRLARGRRWARIPAAVLSAAVGAGAAFAIREQKLDQLLAADREEIVAALHNKEISLVGDIVPGFVERWQSRFGSEDAAVVAWSYLHLELPVRAAEWVPLLVREPESSLAERAIEYGVAYALGDDQRAGALREELVDQIDEGESDIGWARAGAVLTELGELDLARRTVLAAGRHEGAALPDLERAMASIYAQLCEWDEAAEYVEDVLRWRDTPAVHTLAHEIALHRGDWDTAERYLERLRHHPARYVRRRFHYLMARGRTTQAFDWIRRSVVEHADDASILLLVAGSLFEVGEFEDAEAVYRRVLELRPGTVEPLVGLSAVSLSQGRLDDAEEFGRQAVVAEPGSFKAHYNLSQVTLQRSGASYGGNLDDWPLEAWTSWLEELDAALAAYALHVDLLNNTAYALGRIHRLTGDAAPMERALRLADRALRLVRRSKSGACASDAEKRATHSRLLDTISTLREWGGDLEAALSASRGALDVLEPQDDDTPRREARVGDLERRLADG